LKAVEEPVKYPSMDLDLDAEAAEHELEDHNERLDEMALFGTGIGSNAVVAIDMFEVLSCIKDWELEDKHMQNTVENMYLDVEDSRNNRE
jgi:hypothetical protein